MMEAWSAITALLFAAPGPANAGAAGPPLPRDAHTTHAQGALAELRFLLRGANLLLTLVLVVVVVMSLSAIALDWAYFLRGLDVRSAPGLAPGEGVIVNVHRGDGLQVTILKAVIGSVVGFLTMNLLKGTATPHNISRLGQNGRVQRLYLTASAFVNARRSVLCFGAAVGLALAAAGLALWGRTAWAVGCSAACGVAAWGAVQYRRENQLELAIMHAEVNGPELRRDDKVHIAVAGIVGSGKTSLVKALLHIDPQDSSDASRRLGVGSVHDPSQGPVSVEFDDALVLHDLPGDLAVSRNAYQGFAGDFDVGIFVGKGSVDDAQRSIYERLQANVKKTFVVVSRMDELHLTPAGRQRILDQWRERLGTEQVYATSVPGYDPDLRPEAARPPEGVDALRRDIIAYLAERGKGLVLLRDVNNRNRTGHDIILKAVTRVLLGDDLRTVERRAAEQLHYLYTGHWAIRVWPPELHPGLSLFARLVSVVPYVGRLGDTALAASTLVVQLLAIKVALEWSLQQQLAASDKEVQAVADETAARLDASDFRKICEDIWQRGPTVVYQASEEYFSEALAAMVAGAGAGAGTASRGGPGGRRRITGAAAAATATQ